MVKKADNAFFSSSVLGKGINEERKHRGYKNTAEFAEAILDKTGYAVSKDTLYRVECGDQELSVPLMCAITLTLFEALPPSLLDTYIADAACDAWRDIHGRANEEMGIPSHGFLLSADSSLSDVRTAFRALFSFLENDEAVDSMMTALSENARDGKRG